MTAKYGHLDCNPSPSKTLPPPPPQWGHGVGKTLKCNWGTSSNKPPRWGNNCSENSLISYTNQFFRNKKFSASVYEHLARFDDKRKKTNISTQELQAIDETEKLFYWLLDSSNYPDKYENYFYDDNNYWHGITMPINHNKLFKPDLSEKPYVTHPHMNKKFVETFLHIPHIRKTAGNYMLPEMEHHKNTITVKSDEMFYCVELDFSSARSFTKLIVRNLSNSTKIGRDCAEYIFFHGSTMKRIPYDSEIIYFLDKWFGIQSTTFDSFGPDQKDNFKTLVTRIHDCCCLVLHGIKLRKSYQPGRNKPWTRKLKHSEKEFLHDPSLILSPPKKKKKITPLKSPIHAYAGAQQCKVPQKSTHQAPVMGLGESDMETWKDRSKTKIKPTNDPSNTRINESTNNPSTPKINQPTNDVSEKQPNDLSNTSMSTSKNVPNTGSFLSVPIHTEKKNQAPTTNAYIPSVPTAVETPSVATSDKSNCNSNTVAQACVPQVPLDWVQQRSLLQGMQLFPPSHINLPNSWRSTKGASNPQAAIQPDIAQKVINQAMNDYDKICLTDLEFQLDQEKMLEDEEDEVVDFHRIDDLEQEIEDFKAGRPTFESSCSIQLDCITFKNFLNHLFHRNIIWDLGFQMSHLMNHEKNTKYRNSQVTTRCFCPCANYFTAWRKHFNIDDIFCREANKCKGKGIFNTTSSFLQHCSDMSDTCMVHRSIVSYLRHLYPAQTQHKIIPRKNNKKKRLLTLAMTSLEK